MKRARLGICSLILCLGLPLLAAAQGIDLAEPLSGARFFPEGAAEQDARYVFSYAYPQFAPSEGGTEGVNAYYQALARDMADVDMAALAGESLEMPDEGMPAAYTRLDYQVTRNDGRYLSVVLTARHFAGNGESESVSANTFARDGVYAGQLLSLSQVLGLEDAEARPDGQSVAGKLAWGLVWDIVSAGMENVDGDYLDGLTRENVEAAFNPETDFYLDEDGNVVFFVPSGVLAGEVAGVLTFPFAAAEILSAL